MGTPEPWAFWCDGHGLEFSPGECHDKTNKTHPLYAASTIRKSWEEFADTTENLIIKNKNTEQVVARLCLESVVREARRRAKEW